MERQPIADIDLTAGYSGKPLWAKLGIKPGDTILPIGAPSGYSELLGPLPDGAEIDPSAAESAEMIHLFGTRRTDLQASLAHLRETMSPSASLWVSWPKKASGVATDITEDVIREVAIPLGLVDVKVCAVDQVWSGLKLVIRKELRRPR